MEASAPERTTCYRHRDRETGVSCSSCGRPICPDCMTATSVGMRCPECAAQRTKVHTAGSIGGDPKLTVAVIAICAVVFAAQLLAGVGGDARSGDVYVEGALFGPAVADGDWWRIATAGFMHADFVHLAFNMLFLFLLGSLLEPSIGALRMGVIFAVSLLGGSLGALLLEPDSDVVGASGAVFGLLGASILAMRSRGIDPMQSILGVMLVINLAMTFLRDGISIGGHLGGLAAGAIVGLAMFELAERDRRLRTPTLVASIAFGAMLAAASVAVA